MLIATGTYDGWARGLTPLAGILVICGLVLLWAWRIESKGAKRR